MQILHIIPLIAIVISVELPLTLGQNTCAALMSSFDVICFSLSPYSSTSVFLQFSGLPRKKSSRSQSRS